MLELLDVLDERGNPTGEVLPRDEVHSQGLWHRTVHVWITNANGQVLLQQRSFKKADHPGEWDTITGGHLQTGQTVVQGAMRELHEELGLVVEPEKLELLFENTWQSQHLGYANNEFNPTFLLQVDQPISAFTFNDGEVIALHWVSLDQLEELIRVKRCSY